MDEPLLRRCLTLCRRAQERHGIDQAEALLELGTLLSAQVEDLPQDPAREEAGGKRLEAVITLSQGDTAAGWQRGAQALMDQEDWQSEPIIAMDNAGYISAWNRGAQRLFGYPPEEAIGQHILFLYAEDTLDEGGIHELFLEHGSPLIEVKRRKKSGEIFRAKLALSRLADEQGTPVGMVAHFSRISDNLSTDERQRLHASIIEDSDEGILIVDRQEHIVSVNAAFSHITGYASGEVVGKPSSILHSGGHGSNLGDLLHTAICEGNAWHGEIIGKRKNGDLFPQSVSIGVARNEAGSICHAFAIFSDISVLRATEERMKRLVNYDSLTGLPNRSLFNQLLEQTLAGAKRDKDYGALLIIDLCRFTSVNDTLGHDVGDELLRQFAQRLSRSLREQDILARLGGDQFAVALVRLHKREHSGLVADKLLATLNTPFIIDAHALHIGASIGIAVYPEDGTDAMALYRNAEVALKGTQQTQQSGYLFYSPEMNRRAKEQWQLESELRQALASGELSLHFQPKASLRSGRVVGAEALVRWSHPLRGMVPPSQFVALAEETALIVELGNWILEATFRQMRNWLECGVELVPVAINLSPRQFDAQLPARMRELLARHGVPSELIRLEITENLLMHGAESVIAIMNGLAAQGFGLALDDFGTGYSSLAYLKRFPITTLKIDRSFVLGIPQDQNDCAIAQAIVTMGKQLRQEIVAEGVETREQMLFLRELGCDQLQGYLFSPPLAADDFLNLLREGRRLPLA